MDGSYIYWTNTFADTIGRASLDGTQVDQNFIAAPGAPVGIAVDDQHVYWSTDNLGSIAIGRANIDGTGVDSKFITTGISDGSGMAIDDTHIYWANFTTNTIARAKLDGTDIEPSFITGVSAPTAIDVNAGLIYWVNAARGLDYRSCQPRRRSEQRRPELHHRRHRPPRGSGQRQAHLLDERREHSFDRPRRHRRHRRRPEHHRPFSEDFALGNCGHRGRRHMRGARPDDRRNRTLREAQRNEGRRRDRGSGRRRQGGRACRRRPRLRRRGRRPDPRPGRRRHAQGRERQGRPGGGTARTDVGAGAAPTASSTVERPTKALLAHAPA